MLGVRLLRALTLQRFASLRLQRQGALLRPFWLPQLYVLLRPDARLPDDGLLRPDVPLPLVLPARQDVPERCALLLPGEPLRLDLSLIHI